MTSLMYVIGAVRLAPSPKVDRGGRTKTEPERLLAWGAVLAPYPP
jgi:hypothetical protein